MTKTIWTDEIIEFVKKNHYGLYRQELADLVNARFGTSYTANQVKILKAKFKLDSGVKRRNGLRLGETRRGVKLTEEQRVKMSQYWFKKGHKASHAYPIGAEVDLDGYLYVKIDDQPKNRKNWKLKHHIVYEENYGPIPEGKSVMFLDQNRRNFSPENLMLVNAEEVLYMAKTNLIFKDSELNKTAVMVARLETTAKKKMKERGNKNE